MPPLPKSPATRQRTNRVVSAATLPATDGEIVIPELPDGYDRRTVRWWATVQKSPMRGEYTAHKSSPKPDSVAKSSGSSIIVQSSLCHIEASNDRYPHREAGCIACTSGDPRNLSIWNGIHCCHFAAI